MSRSSYWEGYKRPFLTDENARRKWEQLLPHEDFSILDEFHPRAKLLILRWLSWAKQQDKKTLDNLIQTARMDYRDIGIGEWINGWTCALDISREEQEAIEETDAREFVDWLSS